MSSVASVATEPAFDFETGVIGRGTEWAHGYGSPAAVVVADLTRCREPAS
jgi:hypothetical protein